MKLRYTEKSFASSKVSADSQKERIVELEAWLIDFKGGFWKGVCSRINERIEFLRSLRNANLEKLTESELKVSLAAERELTNVIALPARAIDTLNTMKEAHAKALGRINANRGKDS